VWVTSLGEDPQTCARLVVDLAASARIDGVTVPDTAFALLPAALQSPDPGHWSFWVNDGPAESFDEGAAIDLSDDDPRIAELLAHSRSAYVFPGDPRVVRWVGVVVDEHLVSVALQRNETTGAAHICSVVTDPDYRGRRLARHACARIMRLARADGAPALVLEMYAYNESGRRTYEALGFREVGRYRSGLLNPRA
jgi:ribosomal protein S18 acetylase RimI-like enzyme